MSPGERPQGSTSDQAQDHSTDQLPGIKPGDLHLLQKQGITSISDLWQQTRTLEQQHQLATRIHRPLRDVQKWSAMADLARIPGVGCQYCGVLLHIGVRSSQQLAQSSAPKLHQQILRLQVQLFRRRDQCPQPGQIALWIQQAIYIVRRRS